MTVIELLAYITAWLTPNWIKRRQIRPDLSRRNALVTLRNRAYEAADPWPLLLDELYLQNGPSLDRTHAHILRELESLDRDERYWTILIAENAVRRERIEAMERLAREEAQVLTVRIQRESELNDYTGLLHTDRPNSTFDKEMK